MSISDIKTLFKQLFLFFCLYELLMSFRSSRKRPTPIVLPWGRLPERILTCKRPAVVTTTLSHSQGGRLRELQLYHGKRQLNSSNLFFKILLIVLEEQQVKEVHLQGIVIPKVEIVIQIQAVLLSQR